MKKKTVCRALLLALVLIMLWPAAMAQTQPLHILLIGVDSRTDELEGRSDTMLLVRVDPEGSAIRMVSFLRDLYVPIPGKGKARLNAAYRYGGEELLKQTLQESFGVEVHRTVTVQFATLVDLVDQLGGIDLEITESERQQINSFVADHNRSADEPVSRVTESGLVHLNGVQALSYSRIRKIDSDFQRTSRQQAVLQAMLAQASTKSYWELFTMAVSNLDALQTDLTLGDVISLLPMAARLEELTFETAHVPFDGTYSVQSINGASVLVPDPDANRLKLDAFLTE